MSTSRRAEISHELDRRLKNTRAKEISSELDRRLAEREKEREAAAKQRNAALALNTMSKMTEGGTPRTSSPTASAVKSYSPLTVKAGKSVGVDLTSKNKTATDAALASSVSKLRTDAVEQAKKAAAEKEASLSYDLVAGQAEIDKLAGELDAVSGKIEERKQYLKENKHILNDGDARNAYFAENALLIAEEKRLSKLLSEKRLYHRSAQNAQAMKKWHDDALNAEDFEQYSNYDQSAYTSVEGVAKTFAKNALNLGNDHLVSAYINAPDEKSRKAADIALMGEDYVASIPFGGIVTNLLDVESEFKEKGYHLLTGTEKQTFNYYKNKYGEKKALEYLEVISDELLDRRARELQGTYNTWLEPVYNYKAGGDTFVENIKQGTVNAITGSDKVIQYPANVRASEIARSDNTGAWQVANDLAFTTGNMMPSIGASVAANAVLPGAGTYVGSALVGLSSAGGAYDEMIQLGYNTSQAQAYSALVGGSEALIGGAIGGISRLGGGVADDIYNATIGKKLNSVLANAAIKHPKLVNLAKAASKITANGVSEAVEEDAQLFLEPWYKSIVTGEDYKAPEFEEVAYTSLLSFLTGLAFETPEQAAKYWADSKNSQTVGEVSAKEYVSLEDFKNRDSSLWRNVEYDDETTKTSIMRETHDKMLADGAVVKVSDDTVASVDESFPDLREMKKKERTPIIKDAMNKLKTSLRDFLNGFKNQNFEFDVNGKVLEAKLYNTGIDEVLEKITKEKANMLYSTEEIFKNARYLYSTPDYDGDPNVYRWNYFYTPVQIGEEIVGVRIAVRDMNRGTDLTRESQIYNWGIKKDTVLDGGSRGPRVASSGVSSTVSKDTSLDGVSGDSTNRRAYGVSSDVSDTSIPQSLELVKGAETKKQTVTEFPNDLKEAQQVYVQDVYQSQSADTSVPQSTELVKGVDNKKLTEGMSELAVQAMEGGISAVGEDGAADYALDFRSAYHAGRLGVPLESVSASTIMNDAQREAAYALGKADSKASSTTVPGKGNNGKTARGGSKKRFGDAEIQDFIDAFSVDEDVEAIGADEDVNTPPATSGESSMEDLLKELKEINGADVNAELAKDPEIAAVIKEIEAESTESGVRSTADRALGVQADAPKVRAKDLLDRGGMLPTAEQDYAAKKAASAKTETARTGYLSGASEADIRIAESMAKLTGREIIFAGDGYEADGEFDGKNTIIVNPKRGSVLSQIIAHELTHSIEGTEEYKALVKSLKDFVNTYSERGMIADWDTLYSEVWEDYEQKHEELTGEKFDDTKAEKEIVARVMETFFGEGESTSERQVDLTNFVMEFTAANKNAATRIWYELSKLAKRIREDIAHYATKKVWGENYDSSYREHQLMLRKIEDLRDQFGHALMQAKGKEGDGKRALKINDTFSSDIDSWAHDGKPDGERFILGSTGNVLQGLGAIESDIYMNGDKINTILSEHPEMTLDEIKKIPQILENPVLILKSKGATRGKRDITRLVMFGTVKAKDGLPILSVLDLRPDEGNFVVDDMQKVVSAYTKDVDPEAFLKSSDVLYVAENEKITTRLLRTIGLKMPIELNRSGYIGSISYNGQNVNISGEKFLNVFSVKANSGANNPSGKSFSLSKSNTTAQNERESQLRAMAVSMYADMRKAQKAQRATDITEESIYEQTGWYFDDYGNFVVDREAPVYMKDKTVDEKVRTTLVDTLKSGTTNPVVKSKIDEWAADYEKMNAEADKLRSLKAQQKELYFKKGKRDMAKINALREEVTKTQNRIAIYDKKLLDIEGIEPIKRLLEAEGSKTFKEAMAKAEKKAKEADARWRERKLVQINRERIMRLAKRIDKLYTKPTKERNIKEEERILAGQATALARVLFAEKVEKRDAASLEFPYATENELVELSRYRELLARREEIEREISDEMEGERKIIDLSDDDRLSEMVKGVHGSKRYNIIRDYILSELSSEPIVLSDSKLAVVDRRDAQHIARNAGDKKAAEISHIRQIVETAKFVAEESSTKDNKFDSFLYYEALVTLDGETIPVYVNVGRAKNDASYHIYDITQKIRDTAHRVNDVWRPVGNAMENGIPTDSIPQNSESVKEQGETSINSDGAELEAIDREIASLEDLLDPLFDRKLAELRSIKASDIIGKLADSYGDLARSEVGYIQAAYDEDAHDYLQSLKDDKQLDGKTAKEMTSAELEVVYNAFSVVANAIYRSNRLFNEGKTAGVTESAHTVMSQVGAAAGRQKSDNAVLRTMGKLIKWDNLKPETAIELLGSEELLRLYREMQDGELVYAADMDEATDYKDSCVKKYRADKWDRTKLYEFTTDDGVPLELTLGQIMSVYALSKRLQADEHLKIGGIVPKKIVEKLWNKHKSEVGKPGKEGKIKDAGELLKIIRGEATTYKVSDELVKVITSKLTDEQKSFCDGMQKYLSDEMAAKGNEVSMKLYGIELFKEEAYFPLVSAPQYMARNYEAKKGEKKIKNKGFTHNTVDHARNPVVIDDFMDVWAGHVNEMSQYHALTTAIEDFTKVYGYIEGADTELDAVSVRAQIENVHGKNAAEYIDTFLAQLNGGVRRESAGAYEKLVSLSKKNAVLASLSVVVQQPTAGIRAMVYTCFHPYGKIDRAEGVRLWDELKRYAPIAVIKEMGKFDTGMSRSAAAQLAGPKTRFEKVTNTVDNVMGFGAEMMDKLTWCAIWKTCQRKVYADNKSLKLGTEVNKQAAGKLFCEVIRKTQVYDSVFSRTQAMRSKNPFHVFSTAFMSEPMTIVDMVVHAAHKGDAKFFARTMAAVTLSHIVNSVVKSIVYAIRDDDENETLLEKYWQALTSSVLDGLNPLTYIPFAKDIWSLIEGYNVERTDMALIGDFIDAIKGWGNDNKTLDRKIIDTVGAVAAVFPGIPVNNLARDAYGIANFFTTLTSGIPDTGLGTWQAFESSLRESFLLKADTKGDVLYQAAVGDKAHLARMRTTYKSADSYETALKKALREYDPRIREAATALADGDIDAYTDIIEEIIGEGNFSKKHVVSATKTEYNNILDERNASEDEEDVDWWEDYEEDDSDEAYSLYSASDIGTALDSGDGKLAKEIIADLIGTKVKNGTDEKKARSSVKSSITSYYKELYLAAYDSNNYREKNRILDALLQSGLYGKDRTEVKKTLESWEKAHKEK